MNDHPILDRYRGCLLGLATGDALGTTLEFKAPGSFTPITDIIGGGPFNLMPGQWTDDTSLALCLAESLIEKRNFDPIDQLERFVRWWKQGHLSSTGTCFDIGNTTSYSLDRFIVTGETITDRVHRVTAGNGSLMRLAPVPLFYANSPEKAIELSGESSKTTHGAINAIDACRYFSALIVGTIHGEKKHTILSDHYSPIKDYWTNNPLSKEISKIASGSFKQREPPEIRGTGYVVNTLEAALWAFNKSKNFKDGCLLAVNLGDDSDTTGAVYGQIAGAFYGDRGIPDAWKEKLALRDIITDYAERLLQDT